MCVSNKRQNGSEKNLWDLTWPQGRFGDGAKLKKKFYSYEGKNGHLKGKIQTLKLYLQEGCEAP